MDQQQRSTSFRHIFRNQRSASTSVPNSGAYTIPRESTATFYPSKFSPDSSPKREACTMKGWLKRQSVGLMKSSWQCRWFVLFGDHLSYYSSDDDSKPHLGRIYLPGHSLVEHPFGSQQKYIFELQRGYFTFVAHKSEHNSIKSLSFENLNCLFKM